MASSKVVFQSPVNDAYAGSLRFSRVIAVDKIWTCRGAGLFGSRGYSGLFHKNGNTNFLANDMGQNVDRYDGSHLFLDF